MKFRVRVSAGPPLLMRRWSGLPDRRCPQRFRSVVASVSSASPSLGRSSIRRPLAHRATHRNQWPVRSSREPPIRIVRSRARRQSRPGVRGALSRSRVHALRDSTQVRDTDPACRGMSSSCERRGRSPPGHFVLGDQHLGKAWISEQRGSQRLLCGHDRICQPLVLREIADELENEAEVVGGCGADVHSEIVSRTDVESSWRRNGTRQFPL